LAGNSGLVVRSLEKLLITPLIFSLGTEKNDGGGAAFIGGRSTAWRPGLVLQAVSE